MPSLCLAPLAQLSSSGGGKERRGARGIDPRQLSGSTPVMVTVKKAGGTSTKTKSAETEGLDSAAADTTNDMPPPVAAAYVTGVDRATETPAPSAAASESEMEKETTAPQVAFTVEVEPEKTPAKVAGPAVETSEEEWEKVSCGSPWRMPCFDRSRCVGPDGELVRVWQN